MRPLSHPPFGWLSPLGTDHNQQIPLPTADEEALLHASEIPDTLPILSLRNTVLFPGVVLPITLGRDSSLRLVKEAAENDRQVGVIAERGIDADPGRPESLYDIGTVAEILKLVKMPDGSKSVILRGTRRFRIVEYVQTDPYFTARIEPIEEPTVEEGDLDLEAHIRSIKELAVQIVQRAPNLPSEAAEAIQSIESSAFLVYFIASNLQEEVAGKQEILSTLSLVDQAELVLEQLQDELQVMELSEKIRTRVRSDMSEQQREYVLRQQLKAIQDELGETEDRTDLD